MSDPRDRFLHALCDLAESAAEAEATTLGPDSPILEAARAGCVLGLYLPSVFAPPAGGESGRRTELHRPGLRPRATRKVDQGPRISFPEPVLPPPEAWSRLWMCLDLPPLMAPRTADGRWLAQACAVLETLVVPAEAGERLARQVRAAFELAAPALVTTLYDFGVQATVRALRERTNSTGRQISDLTAAFFLRSLKVAVERYAAWKHVGRCSAGVARRRTVADLTGRSTDDRAGVGGSLLDAYALLAGREVEEDRSHAEALAAALPDLLAAATRHAATLGVPQSSFLAFVARPARGYRSSPLAYMHNRLPDLADLRDTFRRPDNPLVRGPTWHRARFVHALSAEAGPDCRWPEGEQLWWFVAQDRPLSRYDLDIDKRAARARRAVGAGRDVPLDDLLERTRAATLELGAAVSALAEELESCRRAFVRNLEVLREGRREDPEEERTARP